MQRQTPKVSASGIRRELLTSLQRARAAIFLAMAAISLARRHSGLIQLVQHLLLDGARAHHVESVIVSSIDHLGDERAHLLRDFRLPCAQLSVQFLGDGIHGKAAYSVATSRSTRTA
jgi:hypothetical protein